MEKFNLWIAKRKLLAFFLLVPTTTFALRYVLLSLDAHKIFTTFFSVIWFVIFSLCIWGVEAVLLDKPGKAFENCCDHTDYLRLLEILISYKKSKSAKTSLLVNYATVLSNIGEYQKAYDILCDINIDLVFNLDFKFVYYTNLACFCEKLGNNEEAVIWNRKAIKIYEDLGECKVKRDLKSPSEISLARIAFIQKEYDKAISIYENIVCNNLRQGVYVNFAAAKCYIELGELEKAKSRLNYAIVNGNKLYVVQEAKFLLEEINKKEN